MAQLAQKDNLNKIRNISRIQSHENEARINSKNSLGQRKPQMQLQDSNSEKSDNLEQVMNSDGENGGDGSPDEAGENPFSKNNRRKLADISPDRVN